MLIRCDYWIQILFDQFSINGSTLKNNNNNQTEIAFVHISITIDRIANQNTTRGLICLAKYCVHSTIFFFGIVAVAIVVVAETRRLK